MKEGGGGGGGWVLFSLKICLCSLFPEITFKLVPSFLIPKLFMFLRYFVIFPTGRDSQVCSVNNAKSYNRKAIRNRSVSRVSSEM